MTSQHLEKFLKSLDDGTSYAAKVFSRMARLSLSSRPAKILHAEHASPPAELFPPGDKLLSGIVPLSGDIFGQAMLIFDEKTAAEVGKAMSGAAHVIAPENAVLEEAVNIFANTAISSITRDFRLAVYAAPPRLIRGGPSIVWRSFVDPVDQPEPRSTVVSAEIASLDARVSGRFLVALRRDSLDNVRWKSVAGVDKRVDVKLGDLRVAAAPGILKVTSLGSCLAVILHDPPQKLGAMAHVMLPNCTVPEAGRLQPGKFADTAVEALLKPFQGAPPSRLRAWLIGGASMFANASKSSQIGQRNVEVVKQRLTAAGIRRYAEETGGTSGRTVELDSSTGTVTLHSSAGVMRVIPHAPGL